MINFFKKKVSINDEIKVKDEIDYEYNYNELKKVFYDENVDMSIINNRKDNDYISKTLNDYDKKFNIVHHIEHYQNKTPSQKINVDYHHINIGKSLYGDNEITLDDLKTLSYLKGMSFSSLNENLVYNKNSNTNIQKFDLYNDNKSNINDNIDKLSDNNSNKENIKESIHTNIVDNIMSKSLIKVNEITKQHFLSNVRKSNIYNKDNTTIFEVINKLEKVLVYTKQKSIFSGLEHIGISDDKEIHLINHNKKYFNFVKESNKIKEKYKHLDEEMMKLGKLSREYGVIFYGSDVETIMKNLIKKERERYDINTLLSNKDKLLIVRKTMENINKIEIDIIKKEENLIGFKKYKNLKKSIKNATTDIEKLDIENSIKNFNREYNTDYTYKDLSHKYTDLMSKIYEKPLDDKGREIMFFSKNREKTIVKSIYNSSSNIVRDIVNYELKTNTNRDKEELDRELKKYRGDKVLTFS